jgi:hypothetical protein
MPGISRLLSPQEEFYYRRIFEDHFVGMAHVINPWEGGCRAAGAEWESESYTREGLANTNLLTHSFQKKATAAYSTSARRSFSTTARKSSTMAVGEVNECEFIRSATESGYDLFQASLTAGGDDRSLINVQTGTNKYHIKPHPIDSSAIFRGSCTCNAPTERGYNAAMNLYDELQGNTGSSLERSLHKIFEDQRRRIAASLELPEGTEIVLCPSGSDAEYIPIAIARTLNSYKKIVNVVTQLREIGAGSLPASGGQHFSTHAPLYGRLPDGAGRLEGFDSDIVSEVSIPARERDGSILDASTIAKETAFLAEQDGAYTIVHGVFGGKTGLRDEEMPPSKDAGRISLGVVDACQGRFSVEELHQWLEQDSVVLFTASKFYQAPPFCGAVLIPKRIAGQLRRSPAPEPRSMFGVLGLGAFVTDKELPECLNNWKPFLRSNGEANNIGLALRWEAGLAGMEALSSTPDAERVHAVEEWAKRVTDLVESQDALDAWCVERSIVSIRLKKQNGGWLNMSELRDVYKYMSQDLSSFIPEATPEERSILATACNLGQPVDVAESHAILRIALGSESLASYLEDSEKTLRDDQVVVKKLALVARYFDQLI